MGRNVTHSTNFLQLSNGYYSHKVYRAAVVVRASLVFIIYDKSLRLPEATAEKAAALTLIGTDADRIRVAFQSVHEIWAVAIESGIGIYALYHYTNWACAGPLVLAIGKSTVCSWGHHKLIKASWYTGQLLLGSENAKGADYMDAGYSGTCRPCGCRY